MTRAERADVPAGTLAGWRRSPVAPQCQRAKAHAAVPKSSGLRQLKTYGFCDLASR